MKLERHPDPLTLLAWAEGELSFPRNWMVARHVRTCWDCRLKAKLWEDTVAEVAAGLTTLPEPTRVDTAKALWRFRSACSEVEVAARPRWWRIRPAWMMPAISVLAVASVAIVATRTPLQRDEAKPPKFSLPPAPRPASAPPVSLEPVPRLPQPPSEPETAFPVVDLGSRPPASEEDLLEAEVYALYELHRARLCRLEVERVGSAVEIHGVMLSPDQRVRLTSLFQSPEYAGLIRLHLEEVSGGQPFPTTSIAPGRDRRAVLPLEERMRERYRGRATERDIFNMLGELVSEAETVSEHAWALRRLAERFPVSRTRILPTALQDLLLRMASDHSSMVAVAAEALWKRLAPDAGAAGEAFQASDPGGRNQTWQDRAIVLQDFAEAAAAGLLSSLSPTVGAAPPPRDRFEYCAAAAKGLHASLQTEMARTR